MFYRDCCIHHPRPPTPLPLCCNFLHPRINLIVVICKSDFNLPSLAPSTLAYNGGSTVVLKIVVIDFISFYFNQVVYFVPGIIF